MAVTTDRNKQIQAILGMVNALIEAVQEAGDDGVPSGVIYAALMGTVPLESYQKLIDLAKRAGRLTERNHKLYATGKGQPSLN